MYQLILLKKARKNLKKIPKSWQIRIYQKIKELQRNPLLGKKLKDKYKNYFSVRVWPYRIIYQVFKKQLIILIIKIHHRGGVY